MTTTRIAPPIPVARMGRATLLLLLLAFTPLCLAAKKPPAEGQKDGYYWYQKSLLSFEAKNFEQAIEELGKDRDSLQ